MYALPPDIVYICLLSTWCIGIARGKEESNINVLRTNLLKTPSLKACPTFSQINNVGINFTFFLHEVISLDSPGVLKTRAYIEFSWKSATPWPTEPKVSITSLKISSNQIWHPKVFVLNSVNNSHSSMSPTADLLVFTSSSVVYFKTRLVLETMCSNNLQFFPFDEQDCDIIFLPLDADCSFNLMELSANREQPEIMVQRAWTVTSQEVYKREFQNDAIIRVYLHLQRNRLVSALFFVAPLLLMSFMTTCILLVPRRHGNMRMYFVLAMFGAEIVFCGYTSASIPNILRQPNLPRFGLFAIFILFQNIIVIIMNLVILRQPPPKPNITEEILKNGPLHTFSTLAANDEAFRNVLSMDDVNDVLQKVVQESASLSTNVGFSVQQLKQALIEAYKNPTKTIESIPDANTIKTTVCESVQNAKPLNQSVQELFRIQKKGDHLTPQNVDLILFFIFIVTSYAVYALIYFL
ncbi:acetylcholine receptor subunit gamma-like [Physella acuta]|uniref:acetylcholine receptor subunit gamma-like n=1 Tax=Physella acuta TaxID=109671 RepID=UPI0027DCA24F|nr:acetylcholine receptor subunit gamma-like [Physella acuta]